METYCGEGLWTKFVDKSCQELLWRSDVKKCCVVDTCCS